MNEFYKNAFVNFVMILYYWSNQIILSNSL